MKPPKLHHIEARNESGELVMFEMPRAGMLFNTGLVTCEGELKVVETIQKLADKYRMRSQAREVLIMDLDDKVKVVNRLRSKGVWV